MIFNTTKSFFQKKKKKKMQPFFYHLSSKPLISTNEALAEIINCSPIRLNHRYFQFSLHQSGIKMVILPGGKRN